MKVPIKSVKRQATGLGENICKPHIWERTSIRNIESMLKIQLEKTKPGQGTRKGISVQRRWQGPARPKKRCATSLSSREMQIQTTVFRQRHTSLRKAYTQNTDKQQQCVYNGHRAEENSAGPVQELDPSCLAGGTRQSVWQLLKPKRQ